MAPLPHPRRDVVERRERGHADGAELVGEGVLGDGEGEQRLLVLEDRVVVAQDLEVGVRARRGAPRRAEQQRQGQQQEGAAIDEIIL